MRRTIGWLAVAVGFLTMPAGSAAQPSNVLTCSRLPSETMTAWTDRCERVAQRAREAEEEARADNEARKKAIGQQLAETDRMRRTLEKQPPLPAARNRLLGRWQSPPSKPAANDDLFGGLAAMLSGCGVLLGDGIVEFTPDRWAIYDGSGRNDMGAISYRAGANGEIYGLPAQGSIFNLLPFQFETADRIRMVNVTCTLVRTNTAPGTGRAGATPAAGRAGAPAAGRATAARAGGASPAPASPSPALPRPGLQMTKDRIGYHCPDGQQLAIDSCVGEGGPDPVCRVVRVDLPPRDGLEISFFEKRDVLVKRAASCTQRGLALKDGVLVLTP